MRRVAGSVYWPHTRLHRKGMATDRQIRMRGTLKGLAAYLVVFLFFALGYVWTRIQVLETGYQLRYLEDVREKLRGENRSLMVEAATLKSPQRLEAVALDMGLKPPAEHQVKFLKIKIAGDL